MSENSVEHIVTVESTQIWRGSVPPERAEFLTQEGTRRNIYGEEFNGQGVGLEFHHEEKMTFECSCGQRFRKGETAREHLEQYRSAHTESEDQ
jgi:hypothetical protein